MAAKPAPKRRSRGHVSNLVNVLGTRIVRGDYPVGETLPVEQDLANELQVGRNAVREAVKVLSGKGLLQTAPRSGTRVCSRERWNMLDQDVLQWHADPGHASKDFMLDLIEVRRIIEPKAAELAAIRSSKADVARILSAYEAMEKQEPFSESKLLADIEFHSAVLEASHNAVLNHFKHAIATYLKAHSPVGQEIDLDVDRDDLERHRKIAWEIAAGKAQSAHDLTVEMLDMNRGHFVPPGSEPEDPRDET